MPGLRFPLPHAAPEREPLTGLFLLSSSPPVALAAGSPSLTYRGRWVMVAGGGSLQRRALLGQSLHPPSAPVVHPICLTTSQGLDRHRVQDWRGLDRRWNKTLSLHASVRFLRPF